MTHLAVCRLFEGCALGATGPERWVSAAGARTATSATATCRRAEPCQTLSLLCSKDLDSIPRLINNGTARSAVAQRKRRRGRLRLKRHSSVKTTEAGGPRGASPMGKRFRGNARQLPAADSAITRIRSSPPTQAGPRLRWPRGQPGRCNPLRHGRSMWRIAFTICRIDHFRFRPRGRGGGRNGSRIVLSPLVRSLPECSPARLCCTPGGRIHMRFLTGASNPRLGSHLARPSTHFNRCMLIKKMALTAIDTT